MGKRQAQLRLLYAFRSVMFLGQYFPLPRYKRYFQPFFVAILRSRVPGMLMSLSEESEETEDPVFLKYKCSRSYTRMAIH